MPLATYYPFTPSGITLDATPPVVFAPAGVGRSVSSPLTFQPPAASTPSPPVSAPFRGGMAESTQPPTSFFAGGEDFLTIAQLQARNTVGVTCDQNAWARTGGPSGFQLWQLFKGDNTTNLSANPAVVCPADYNAISNAKYWLAVTAITTPAYALSDGTDVLKDGTNILVD